MKKLFFLLVFSFVLLNAKSQVVDTTVSFITACKIQPVKVKITDTAYSVKLGVKSLGDNLNSSANLYGCFIDSKNHITNDFNYLLTGKEYADWDGSSSYLFKIFATKFSLSFTTQ
jgi:hypothetical protein